MLYYITYTNIPSKRAFGFAIAKMCASFAENIPVTLVVPKIYSKEKREDIFSYYDLPRNFSILELPNIDLFGTSFIGKYIPFIIKKITFALATVFLKIKSKDVCYSRDLWPLLFIRMKTRNIFLEIHYLSKFDSFSIRFTHFVRKIIVITSFLKDELITFGYNKDNIYIAPDAVDIDEFDNIKDTKDNLRRRFDLPLNKKIILYSGNLFPWKGVYTLTDSLEFIDVKILQDLIIVFVGGTDDVLIPFEKYVQSKEYRDKVIITGYKRHNEIAYYLKAADILVIPNSSKEKISNYNTSPLKLFEYMASEVPIIASDVPSIREIMNNNNCIFSKPDDGSSIAKCITILLSDQRLVDRLSKQARYDVDKYTWKKRAMNILDFLNIK